MNKNTFKKVAINSDRKPDKNRQDMKDIIKLSIITKYKTQKSLFNKEIKINQSNKIID